MHTGLVVIRDHLQLTNCMKDPSSSVAAVSSASMKPSVSGDRSQAILTRSIEVATTIEPNHELPGFHAARDDWNTRITPRHVQWIGAEERLTVSPPMSKKPMRLI